MSFPLFLMISLIIFFSINSLIGKLSHIPLNKFLWSKVYFAIHPFMLLLIPLFILVKFFNEPIKDDKQALIFIILLIGVHLIIDIVVSMKIFHKSKERIKSISWILTYHTILVLGLFIYFFMFFKFKFGF
ncbi:hypothetical protein B9T35_04535 [Acinetobacter sp. ANC 3832]|nr:hypothetical protein B9T35_04535 [Acinetobacter sp. ANC 3832]